MRFGCSQIIRRAGITTHQKLAKHLESVQWCSLYSDWHSQNASSSAKSLSEAAIDGETGTETSAILSNIEMQGSRYSEPTHLQPSTFQLANMSDLLDRDNDGNLFDFSGNQAVLTAGNNLDKAWEKDLRQGLIDLDLCDDSLYFMNVGDEVYDVENDASISNVMVEPEFGMAERKFTIIIYTIAYQVILH